MNLNEEGKEYKYIAIEGKRVGVGFLQEPIINLISEIKKKISELYNKGNSTKKKRMESLLGCIDRLENIIIISHRIANYTQEILSQKSSKIGTMAFVKNEVLFDFESMLFHGRALLDRLTFFLSQQLFNQECDVFNKLNNVLKNFQKKDKRVNPIIKIISLCKPVFSGLLIDGPKNKKSLRSTLIHKSTIGENTTCAFTIHILADNNVLYLDYEIQKFPVINSSRSLLQYLLFAVLKIITIILQISTNLKLVDFKPQWECKLISYSKFIDPKPSNPSITVIKMLPSGFELITRKVSPEIFNYSVKK